MWDQEKKHLAKFNEILAENRVRPTALLPFWNLAGFVLGWYIIQTSSIYLAVIWRKDDKYVKTQNALDAAFKMTNTILCRFLGLSPNMLQGHPPPCWVKRGPWRARWQWRKASRNTIIARLEL